MKPEDLRLSIESALPEEELTLLRGGMRHHTESQVAWEGYEDITVVLRGGEGAFLGAALGEIGRGWLHVSVIWVEENLRRQGWGGKLLALLEAEARQRDCHGAYLDTFSYQARPFYERQGYEVFGTLENYPPGHCRHFMRKRL